MEKNQDDFYGVTREMEKRFIILLSIVLGGWLICYLFILKPSENQVKKLQKEIKGLSVNIESLYSQSYNLQEEFIEQKEISKNKIADLLKEFEVKVNIASIDYTNTSILDFRSELSNKLRALQTKGNLVGVEFPEGLGFDNISTVSQGSWICLNLIYEVLNRFMTICESIHSEHKILSITYPDIHDFSKTSFINTISIELVLDTNYTLLHNFLNNLIQASQKNRTYFCISELQTNVESNYLLRNKLVITALYINRNGVLQEEKIESPTDTPATGGNIWERY